MNMMKLKRILSRVMKGLREERENVRKEEKKEWKKGFEDLKKTMGEYNRRLREKYEEEIKN